MSFEGGEFVPFNPFLGKTKVCFTGDKMNAGPSLTAVSVCARELLKIQITYKMTSVIFLTVMAIKAGAVLCH